MYTQICAYVSIQPCPAETQVQQPCMSSLKAPNVFVVKQLMFRLLYMVKQRAHFAEKDIPGRNLNT